MAKYSAVLVALALTAGAQWAHSDNGSGSGTPTTNDSTTGTDTPTLQVTVTDDQRLLMQFNEADATVVGSTTVQQGYGELTLDAVDTQQGQVQPDWGRAEVLLGCGQADVIVYRNQQGQWLEHSVNRIAIDTCAGQ